MYKTIFAISLVGYFVLPFMAHAGPILRSGESVTVDASQEVKGDFYGVGQNISISGRVENDVYVAGMNVTINAPISQDVTIIGGVVQVHGEVGDDVRILGGDVTIASPVKGDVVVYGGTLTILSTASIEGDLIFSGENLLIEGEVVGAVHGLSKNIRVNAKVGGDILYTAIDSIALGDKADVGGSITYESKNQIIRAAGAVVVGKTYKTETEPEHSDNFLVATLFEIGILIFAAFSLFLLGKRHMQVVVEKASLKIGFSGLIGIGVLLLIPFISLILMMSVVGILIGVMLFIVYLCLLILSFVLASVLIGYHIQKLLMKRNDITLYTILIGVVSLNIVSLVPYIGNLLIFASVLVVLGSISQLIYPKIRA